MGDMMQFPKTIEEFIHSHSFNDRHEVYTNNAELIPTYRVFQAIEHYMRDVNHGEWHFFSDDLYDVTNTPTEEGWYRIITIDGKETTDYYFGKPTFTARGVAYWKTETEVIKAWAKIKE